MGKWLLQNRRPAECAQTLSERNECTRLFSSLFSYYLSVLFPFHIFFLLSASQFHHTSVRSARVRKIVIRRSASKVKQIKHSRLVLIIIIDTFLQRSNFDARRQVGTNARRN